MTMRSFFLMLCFILNFLVVFAQEPLKFAEVVLVEGAAKSELFERATIWFNTNQRSTIGDVVLKHSNEELGELVGEARINYTTNKNEEFKIANGYIEYTIKISVSDEVYNFEFSNFIHHVDELTEKSINFDLLTYEETYPNSNNVDSKLVNKIWNDIKLKVINNSSSLIENLKKTMSTSVEP